MKNLKFKIKKKNYRLLLRHRQPVRLLIVVNSVAQTGVVTFGILLGVPSTLERSTVGLMN